MTRRCAPQSVGGSKLDAVGQHAHLFGARVRSVVVVASVFIGCRGLSWGRAPALIVGRSS
jgi:hypothetical protein